MAGLIVSQWVAFGWHPRILGRSWREGDGIQIADGHTYIHAYRQTYIHTWLHTYILTDILTCKQLVPRQASQPGLGAMEIACNAMEIAAKQTLCLEAGLETGLEAMEIAMDAIESGAKQTLG